MTRRIAASATDTVPVSEADLARVAAEEKLMAEHRSRTALVIASSSRDVEDCRLLLDILGLDTGTVEAALSSTHSHKRAMTPKRSAKSKGNTRRRTAA